jgi:hypothetical protein
LNKIEFEPLLNFHSSGRHLAGVREISVHREARAAMPRRWHNRVAQAFALNAGREF